MPLRHHSIVLEFSLLVLLVYLWVCEVFWFGVCVRGVVCFGFWFFFKIIVNAQDFSVDTALGSVPFLTGKGPLSQNCF